MKTFHKILLIAVMAFFSISVFGQATNDADALVKQGVALHDQGKYAEAIAKYDEALKLNPDNQTAIYEKSYTLFATGKGKEALPYLERLIKLNPASGGAFDMLGSIYDDDKQYEKAIEYYLQGVKVAPEYQRLYYNLAISYYRQAKYDESEKYAISAIRLDPKHASSQRVYAMATYKEEKRGISLLAWCSFLQLEPQTQRSAEAYKYIQNILSYGIKVTGEKSVTINVSPKDMDGPNFVMPITILAATTDKKGLSRADSLTLQLQRLFEVSAQFAGKNGNDFYKKFFSDYYKSLSASDNMPAFARLISLSAYQEDNLKWFKENGAQLKSLTDWIAATKREF